MKITLCIFMIGVFSFASFSFASQLYSLLESGSSLTQTGIEETQDGQTTTGDVVVLISGNQQTASGTVELKSKKSIEELEHLLSQKDRGSSIKALIITILLIVIGLGLEAVWIYMLFHAINYAPKNKTLWIVVIIFGNVLGALLYYFVERKEIKISKTHKYRYQKIPKKYQNPKNN